MQSIAVDAEAAPSVALYLSTPEFPLEHVFLDPEKNDFRRDVMVVQMDKYVRFLGEASNVMFCPLLVCRTRPHMTKPDRLEDFVTIARQVDGHAAPRYKFSEGLWNLGLTERGEALEGDCKLLTVRRQCAKGCGAIALSEMVTVGNLRDRTLHIQFTSFGSRHTPQCVPEGATKRSQLLIGSRVAVKEIGRDPTVRPRDIEEGSIKLSLAAHGSETASLAMHMLDGVPIEFARGTLKRSRAVNRHDGDFDAVHRLMTGVGKRAETSKTLEQLNILQYHPCKDVSCKDPDNPDSWFGAGLAISCCNRGSSLDLCVQIELHVAQCHAGAGFGSSSSWLTRSATWPTMRALPLGTMEKSRW
jgi:hypothetical protein